MAKVLSLLCLSMELSASMNAKGYTQNKTTLQNSLPEATTFSKGLSVTNGGVFQISRRQTLIFSSSATVFSTPLRADNQPATSTANLTNRT